MTLVEIAPPSAPRTTPSERAPGPEQVEQQNPPESPPAHAAPTPRPAVAVPAFARSLWQAPPAGDSSPSVPAIEADNSKAAARAGAPEARPVPPAPKATDDRPRWEGLVLAALHRAKRYPRTAERQREEGTSWIRFVMDRRGRVHSVVLQRTSGSEVLDREALALPARAQPLPRPPRSISGSRIEIVIPIEFVLHSSEQTSAH